MAALGGRMRLEVEHHSLSPPGTGGGKGKGGGQHPLGLPGK